MKYFLVIASAIFFYASSANIHASSDINLPNKLNHKINNSLVNSSISSPLTLQQNTGVGKSQEVLYQNLVLGIPYSTHYIVNMIAFVQMMMVQTDQASNEGT